MKTHFKIAIVSFLFIFNSSLYSQCKTFTKKKCLPELKPYLSNGQLHNTQLQPGEKAKVNMSLNQGLSYRVVICQDAYLEETEYQLENEHGRVFSSGVIKNGKAVLDFKVKETANYSIHLNVPEKENAGGMIRLGCITVLIGFKE